MFVLIVDDQPWNLDLEYLRDHYTDDIFELVTHPHHLSEWHMGQADVILLDHRMPGTKGDELAHAMRKRPFTGPILRISTFQEGDYPADCPWVGKHCFSVKRFGYIRRFVQGKISESKMLEGARR